MSEQVWRRGPLVAEVRSETADTIALLHLDTGTPRVLKDTAAVIWTLIDGHRSQSQIVSELTEQFDAPAALISAHVEDFITGLKTEKLIEQAPAEAADPGMCPRNGAAD